jgi:hypothetical protein
MVGLPVLAFKKTPVLPLSSLGCPTQHGFGVALIAGLVNQRLATLTHEKVRAGDKLIEVAKVRITAAGRDALGSESGAAPKIATCGGFRRS